MKNYVIRLSWQHKGTGYERQESQRYRAASMKAAIAKALTSEARKGRVGWREAQNAGFQINVVCLGKIPLAGEEG